MVHDHRRLIRHRAECRKGASPQGERPTLERAEVIQVHVGGPQLPSAVGRLPSKGIERILGLERTQKGRDSIRNRERCRVVEHGELTGAAIPCPHVRKITALIVGKANFSAVRMLQEEAHVADRGMADANGCREGLQNRVTRKRHWDRRDTGPKIRNGHRRIGGDNRIGDHRIELAKANALGEVVRDPFSRGFQNDRKLQQRITRNGPIQFDLERLR